MNSLSNRDDVGLFHIPEKLICVTGLPRSGKSSVTAELGSMLHTIAFCGPEESVWPECVTKRGLSGAFGAHMWFRSMRMHHLNQARLMATEGRTVFVDSYFDKLLYFCLGKPGMEWLIHPNDPYFDVMRQIARLDLETLPIPDCLIFFELDYGTWGRMLQTRPQQTETGMFTSAVFQMQEYIKSGIEFLRKHFGMKTLVVHTQLDNPKRTAEHVVSRLCDTASRTLDHVLYPGHHPLS